MQAVNSAWEFYKKKNKLYSELNQIKWKLKFFNETAKTT